MTLATVRHVITVEKTERGKEYIKKMKAVYDETNHDTRVEYQDDVMVLTAKAAWDLDDESATCD